MKKNWNIKIDGRELNESEIIDALLESRGIKDVDKFLQPSEEDMLPFENLIGIEKAAKIVMDGVDNETYFLVHFDVDTDGVSSGAIMSRYLKNFTDNVGYMINKGKEHGVENFPLSVLDSNTILIVVDSLNNDPNVYNTILETGCKLIVLDHHLIEEDLWQVAENYTDSFCLVSSANNYPNPALSGAGVVFKFCKYLDELNWTDYADDFWDLAATGIIADMCDLSEQSPENRYICHMGIKNQKNAAISKINGSFGFDAKAVSFGVAPLVNAACRTGENQTAALLFTSDDDKEIASLIKELKKCKEKQNSAVSDQMDELIEQGNAQLDKKCMYFFVDTDAEVAGLIGNKLLEKYQRPLFVLRSTGDGMHAGSMRAIGLQNFAQMINDTGIGKCMGHELAAGAFIPADRFEEFKNKIEDALKDVEFVQSFDVDIQLDNDQITDTLIAKIKELNKISGSGFAPITVMVGEVSDFTIGDMSKGKHLKITTPNVTFIKWNFSEWDDMWDTEDKELYGVGQLDSGFFGRTYYRQLILSDFKLEDIW